MNHAWNPEQAKNEIDDEGFADTAVESDGERWEKDREDDEDCLVHVPFWAGGVARGKH